MDVLEKIKMMRTERGWSEYQLAKQAGLPYSTVSSWYKNNITPSISSLEHICSAFGITLSQFFLEKDSVITKLPSGQSDILLRWDKMTKEQQEKLAAFIDSII